MERDEKMGAVVEVYQKSGIGATKFATIENLSIHELKHWINKFKKEKASKTSFIQIKPTSASLVNDWVETEYHKGLKIKLTTKEAPFLSQLNRVY
jgi:hypothetical protein